MGQLDLLLALATFCTVTCFTPGPNNTMLMASGLNFGFARTVPHLLGVTFGFAFMVLAVGLGIGQLFDAFPEFYRALKAVSIVYLLWLAWGIATAGAVEGGPSGGRPLTFLEAAAFQWVNPKGWVMAVGATATYIVADRVILSVLVIALAFALIGLGSSTTWALFGTGLRRVIDNPRTVRLFNVTMALLLVASLYPIVADLLPWGSP